MVSHKILLIVHFGEGFDSQLFYDFLFLFYIFDMFEAKKTINVLRKN